ncbi:ABC transporter ATP-binding protein [Patescibacteria group bacterium]|nr:ABC transporter ATP-binding protein [Patescibacteria group bacterium]
MKHLLQYLKKYTPWILLVFVLIGAQGFATLALPDYTSKIIDDGIAKNNMQAVWSNGLKMLAITVLAGIFAVGVGYLASKISGGYAKKIREEVFKKVENFSLSGFNTFSSSSLITRATNDIQQIQNIFSILLRLVLIAPLMGIGAIIKAYKLAPSMSWIIIVAMFILLVLIITIFFIAVPKFKVIQKLVDKIGLQTKEMITGVRVIRAYNKDKLIQDKFDEVNKQSTKLNLFVTRFMGILAPVMTLIMGLTSVGIVWFGSHLINQNLLEVGDILALIQYITLAIIAFLMFSVIFILIPRAAVSIKRVEEVLTVEPSIKDPQNPKHFSNNMAGSIEFKNVGFRYEDSEQTVLANISFIANPGKVTAIIGGTGSGKTTLLNLIPRLYDVSSGAVLIDGIDVRDVEQKELRDAIAYVPQKAQLFFGTIKDNMLYARENATDAEIYKALDIAQATEFVNLLPKKLDDDVSQGGSNLSGGQKQRLTIARAILKRSKIYLFDDCFSALDFKTDALVRNALNKELSDATILIVGQRISTIMGADNIIVLDNGRIAGQGKHEYLLKTCSVYQEIVASQLSEKEINNTTK